MEIVGNVVGDVCRQAGCQIPRRLWTTRYRRGDALGVPGEKTADVDLVVGVTAHVVVAVGGVEMPLGAKIVVQASYGKVVGPPHRHVVFELQHIQAVAAIAEASTG